MIPCPLCLLGFEEPHSKEDWAGLGTDNELKERLGQILENRHSELVRSVAEELFYRDNPRWLKRWGWTEVPQVRKQYYLNLAEEELKELELGF